MLRKLFVAGSRLPLDRATIVSGISMWMTAKNSSEKQKYEAQIHLL